jgi:hypothetical protein
LAHSGQCAFSLGRKAAERIKANVHCVQNINSCTHSSMILLARDTEIRPQSALQEFNLAGRTR